jgi:hypothetical protein
VARSRLVIGLVVVVLAAAGVIGWVVRGRGGADAVQAEAPSSNAGATSSNAGATSSSAGATSSSAGATSSSAQPPPLTAERAQQLQTGLASGNEPATRGVVAIADGQTIDPAVVTALALYPVTFDTTTFATDNDGTASVTATVASNPPTAYTVFLVAVDGKWLITATVPA